MRENRLIYKIGGPPHAIRDINKSLETVHTKEGETAQAAMAHAVPKDILDGVRGMITGKTGRPTKYTPEMALLTFDRLSDPKRCWTLKAIAHTMGIDESTFYDWLKIHRPLQLAVDAGRSVQEQNFGAMLLHGFKYSSGVEFILSNLHNWSHKERTEHVLDLNAAIAAQEQGRKPIEWDKGIDIPKAPSERRSSDGVIDVQPEAEGSQREEDAENDE